MNEMLIVFIFRYSVRQSFWCLRVQIYLPAPAPAQINELTCSSSAILYHLYLFQLYYVG